ncbi:TPA: hypothetical protein MH388_28585 [Klebsiella pneumoniae]|nr:hypothetical protein [Klebsiella pneumoniae]HBX5204987.1 hypothetical protein [Klebsiella pneumoniae]HBX5238870.1 hypothetical protein [Klebsiella pneumoniae]HBX5288814.1 hypothetical protein [Klebsiella pneumoniae]HBX5305225.1 hypothetical protein [Klebsiella pneumoniae]
MNFTIKSRNTGEIFSFYAPDSGGYVHLESQGHSGNSGAQICRGGGCSQAARRSRNPPRRVKLRSERCRNPRPSGRGGCQVGPVF